MKYTVFDVETANDARDSICSIGIVRFEDDRIVFQDEVLINPETEFGFHQICVHGITEEKVKDAPNFAEAWENIRPYFEDTILVAHNAKSMDLCALYRSLQRYDLPLVNNEYICTKEIAEYCMFEKVGLKVLCKHFGIRLDNHHNSLCDTIACYELLNKFLELYPDCVEPRSYDYLRTNKRNHVKSKRDNSQKGVSKTVKDCRQLYLLAKKLINDGQIDSSEIEELHNWLLSHDDLKGCFPFDQMYDLVEDILEDNVMDAKEERQLFYLLESFVYPVSDVVSEGTIIDFTGKNVCVTGEFSYGDRTIVKNRLIELGANIKNNVSGKLDILIAGELGNPQWKFGTYGDKFNYALEKNYKNKIKGIDKRILLIREKDIDL